MAKTKAEVIDNLADDVLSVINKKYKEFPDAAGYLTNANLVTGWVKSGSDILDLAVSNRPNGGTMGLGGILEISGLEGSGKSLLAATMLAECQKMGGTGVLFDTEKAVGMLDFYVSLGLDPDKLIYIDRLRALEEVYDAVALMIERAVASNTNKPLLIVIDSVMGASTLTELEADYGKDGYATAKAIINSKAMRKIPGLLIGRKIGLVLINQLRANMNAGLFSDKFTTTGGNAIPFTASVRLRVKKLGAIKVANVPVGEQIEVSVVKNRLGPPRRKVKLDMYYESGLDNYGGWLTVLKEFGFLKQSGSSYSYVYVDGETGEEVTKKFQSKHFKKLLTDDPALKEMIYKQICDAYIMKYKLDDDFGIDDIEIDTNIEED
jgi:recombination protein RecA